MTLALAGAPPRRVSGKGQQGIYWRPLPSGGIAFGSKAENHGAKYMMILEKKGHPWLHKTVKKFFPDALRIWKGEINKPGTSLVEA